MAIIDLQHTIQKFTQLTQQSFAFEFESIANSKDFVNTGKFKAKIRQVAEDIYNGAKYSGLENEEALEQLEEAQKELINSYAKEYQKLLKNNNQPTGENIVLPTEQRKAEIIKNNIRANGDIDPEIVQIGSDERDPGSYATFFNGRRMGKNISSYAGTNNTFSMCDMVCQIDIVSNTGKHVVATLGKLQTLSYSIFQNKAPVRVVGNMNARDYVYGQRTIAGSLIFAVFNKHWLIDLYDEIHNTEGMKNWHFIADEIPPFNITISFANEYGYDSRMAIYGVRLVNEGQTMSINDIYIENTYEYVATDIEILDSLNAWQSSDKLGRRYNMTGAIASPTQQQSGNDTPKMQGQAPNDKNNVDNVNDKSKWTKVTFTVPQKLQPLTEEQLKYSTEEDLLSAIKKAHDDQVDIWQHYLEEYKIGKTIEEQQKAEQSFRDAVKSLGMVYSKQWDDIKAYYKKAEQNKVKQDT